MGSSSGPGQSHRSWGSPRCGQWGHGHHPQWPWWGCWGWWYRHRLPWKNEDEGRQQGGGGLEYYFLMKEGVLYSESGFGVVFFWCFWPEMAVLGQAGSFFVQFLRRINSYNKKTRNTQFFVPKKEHKFRNHYISHEFLHAKKHSRCSLRKGTLHPESSSNHFFAFFGRHVLHCDIGHSI